MLQLTAIDLLDIEFPIFEEATQIASHFLGLPICVVGIPDREALILKAAVGLSQLGLMNPLARTRRLSLADELIGQVLQHKQHWVLSAVEEQASPLKSYLVSDYNIQAYLGVPLLTAEGACLGVLAAMGTEPFAFAPNAIAFMEMLARWSVSEYERHLLAHKLVTSNAASLLENAVGGSPDDNMLDTVRLTLMSQLTQAMRNPLTTITGMASILSREIYGTLTPKQREYAAIVHDSSQSLLAMANEVLELSSIGSSLQSLNLTPADLEILAQHIETSLKPVAEKCQQSIQFTVEPGSHRWMLDKELVRHLLYHLAYPVITLASEGGIVRIHASERDNHLNITLWHSHQWMGEGLPNTLRSLNELARDPAKGPGILSTLLAQITGHAGPVQLPNHASESSDSEDSVMVRAREMLSLMLSHHLVAHHNGRLVLQGSSELGHRFLAVLPLFKEGSQPSFLQRATVE